jgi:enterobactin synthetase component D
MARLSAKTGLQICVAEQDRVQLAMENNTTYFGRLSQCAFRRIRCQRHSSGPLTLFPVVTAMFEHGASVSQLHYEYSDATFERLRSHAVLPARLGTAVLRRRVDFLAGRWCAQRALQAAGFEDHAEIATGEHGAPIWPPNVVGSISHCNGFAIACVGHATRIAAMGVDIEKAMAPDVASDIRGQLASEDELTMAHHGGMSPEAWLTVLFSGKESLFKALYPGVGHYFDFLDAKASHLDPHARTFMLNLCVALSPEHPQGSAYPIHFQWNEGFVLTHCLLPALRT